LKSAIRNLDSTALKRSVNAIEPFIADRRKTPDLFSAFFSTLQTPQSFAKSSLVESEKAALRAEIIDLEQQLNTAKQEFEQKKTSLANSMKELQDLEHKIT
jgi:outer membrane protein TolC